MISKSCRKQFKSRQIPTLKPFS